MAAQFDPKETGHRLARYRKDRKLTQQQVAEAVGLGRATITRMETGNDTYDMDYYDKLADFYGKPLAELLGIQSTAGSGYVFPPESIDDLRRTIREEVRKENTSLLQKLFGGGKSKKYLPDSDSDQLEDGPED